LSIDADKLSVLITLVTGGKINRGAYKETVEAVFTNNIDPEKYIAEKGLMMINDDNAVITAVKAVVAENQDSVADYRAGKEKVFGFLMGQVMKKLGGKGNPDTAKKMLEDALKEG
jgi:aspartyl-tRNA(Asn)/glutamyl-tRNA(Gln) amidotransferase subunit B